MVSNRTLGKVALYGAFACIGGGLLITNRIRNNFKQTSFYQDSLQILLSHSGAISVLGKPIKTGDIDLGNVNDNVIGAQEARLVVPVKGSKDEGKLYLLASRKSLEEPWMVQRLELELNSDTTRRLVVHKTVDDTQ